MDKYDKLLDIIENPERYTDDEISQLLSDPEVADLYQTISATSSVLHHDCSAPDVDAEWERFSRKHRQPRRNFRMRHNVAATIIAIVAITACATGIGMRLYQSEPAVTETTAQTGVDALTPDISGRVMPEDSTAILPEIIIFDNQRLDVIVRQIAERHGLKAGFRSPATAGLRMYLKWETSTPVEKVVETLNTFEQIDIEIIGDSIAVGGK